MSSSKSKYTIYTQDAKSFESVGWTGSKQRQRNNLETSIIWANTLDSRWIRWKIVDNENGETICSNA